MTMQLLAPLLAYTAAAGLLTVTPGLDTAMVLRCATTGGPRRGGAAALGISLGCMVWGIGAAYGLTALLATSELAFTAVKWAGAAYLFWLGLVLLFKRRKAFPDNGRSGAVIDGGRQAFQRGLLTNLMNPKVGIFYITFLPQFIPHGADVTEFALLLASIHVAMNLAWFAVLIALTVPLGLWLARPEVAIWLDRAMGLVFIGFGLRLVFTEPR